jgi:hypothetical protein
MTSPMTEALANSSVATLAAQMSPLSKVMEQMTASMSSPMLEALGKMTTADVLASTSQVARVVAGIDPEVLQSIVTQVVNDTAFEELDEAGDPVLVDPAAADALMGTFLVVLLYLLTHVAAEQVKANLAIIKMFFDSIDYEVARHPAVGGFLILWGAFGPSIWKALHSDGDSKIGEGL